VEILKKMTQTHILIIGAGAAGLAAAYELSLVDKKLIVLEARDRIGGRIYSIRDERFAQTVEAGAEFIHGELPVTLNLLKKAGIEHYRANGRMWEVEKGQIKKNNEFIVGWNKLMKELKALKTDIAIKDFLEEHFPDEKDRELRESVIGFVQGYDAADITKASSFALKEEWEKDDEHQERIENGYGQLMNYLVGEIKSRGSNVLLSKVVKQITWQKGRGEVITNTNEIFVASKVLITIPLGVWQADGEEGAISFTPELIEKKEAAKKMGYGAVMKLNFQFKNQFWEEETPNKFKDAFFIFSDAEIPTWWTQEPVKNGLLTGWLTGPAALQLKNATEQKIYTTAVHSLAYIFGVDNNFIEERLLNHYTTNWIADPFTRGAYSYATLDTHWAKDVLAKPLEQTLYFAGEALYNGTEAGTVEGALANGIEVTRKMIAAGISN
jgi:monoamine oxidase